MEGERLMVKLIIGAVAAVAATAVAAVLATTTDAPNTLVVIGAVLGAVVVPLGGYAALATLVKLLPEAVRDQITLVIGTLVAALEAVVATSVHVDSFAKLSLAVLVAVGGASGLWVRVTPLSNPRDADGASLVPR